MLLALDSATRRAGLALYDGEVVRAESTWSASGVYHTEWLTPAIDEALKRISATAADLSAVGVTTGPGSFTGLRVALSLAKGIAAAQSLPIVGIPTLDVTAYPHVGAGHAVLAMLPSGRGRHAYAVYGTESERGSLAGSKPSIADIRGVATALEARAAEHEGETVLVAGELTPAERQFLAEQVGRRAILLSPALCVRRPAVLAEIAWARFTTGDVDDIHTLEPFYLHLPTTGRS